MRHRNRRKPQVTGKKAILLIISISLLAGICVGALAAGTMNEGSLRAMDASARIFFHSFEAGFSRMDIFLGSLFKYGKIILAVWLLAFAPVGSVVAFMILFAKGIGFGYTTAFLVRSYGAAGAFYGALLYLPQNIVMVPAYFICTYACVHFILHTLQEKNGINAQAFTAYLLILLISGACVVLAAFIEAWLSPALINGVIAKFL